MDTLKEILRFLFTRKKFWLLPAIVAIALASLLLVSYILWGVAPLVYPLF